MTEEALVLDILDMLRLRLRLSFISITYSFDYTADGVRIRVEDRGDMEKMEKSWPKRSMFPAIVLGPFRRSPAVKLWNGRRRTRWRCRIFDI